MRFHQLEFIKASHQLSVKAHGIPETAILFDLSFLRLPFWLRHLTQLFQRFTDHMLNALHFACAYVTGVLGARSSIEELLQRMQLIFECFQNIELLLTQLNVSLVTRYHFLGHYIN